jgi:type II secretion system protein N
MNHKVALRYIIYLAVFIFFTLLFIVLNFPAERTTQLVNQTLAEISDSMVIAGKAEFTLPFSLKVEDISVQRNNNPLNLGEAIVTPSLLALITGRKKADVRLQGPWIVSRFLLSSQGDGGVFVVRSMDIDLSRLPETDSLPFELSGNIEATADLQSEDWAKGIFSGEARTTSGAIVADGGLLGTFGLAPLEFSKFSAVATIEENVMTLGETFIEGDISATARGTVRITTADYKASRLDLALELKPASQYRERLLPIFGLMGVRPRTDGTVNFRIRGTIGRPSITM